MTSDMVYRLFMGDFVRSSAHGVNACFKPHDGDEAAALQAKRCLISVGFYSVSGTGDGLSMNVSQFHWQPLSKHFSTGRCHLQCVLAQVWFLLAVHRKVHILYRRCAILMKGKLLKLSIFCLFSIAIWVKQNKVWNVFVCCTWLSLLICLNFSCLWCKIWISLVLTHS